jgi:myo-inositol-1(or 4)-monophosphatase
MEFLSACEEMAELVGTAIADLVDSEDGDQFVKMGADGTPTKKIDQVAEDLVVEYLISHSLCKTLISEECGHKEIGGPKGTIFLDPVDGTYNALSGIPFYAISIAYAEEGIVKQAFVRDLANHETFTAVLGRGACHNGEKVVTSSTSLLEASAMSIYGRKFDPANVMDLGRTIRRWRLLGASALELCYTGCGRLDGFVDLRGTLRVTDAAAGILVCTEAGGTVTDRDGLPLYFPDEVTIGRCLVATNGVLHPKVIEYLR